MAELVMGSVAASALTMAASAPTFEFSSVMYWAFPAPWSVAYAVVDRTELARLRTSSQRLGGEFR